MPDNKKEDLSAHLESLNQLAPEARARVSAALKASIDSELQKTATGPGLKAAEFSKGAFFSRSRGNAMLDEARILEQATKMDADSFAKFAQNLQTLKGLKGTGGGS